MGEKYSNGIINAKMIHGKLLLPKKQKTKNKKNNLVRKTMCPDGRNTTPTLTTTKAR